MTQDTVKHDCGRFETWIALDAEGDLPAGESRELERHLAACTSCRRFTEEMAASQQVVRDQMQPPFDEEVLARVRAGVLDRIARPRARVLPFRRRVAARWVALAAVVLAAIGLWRLGLGPPPGETEPVSPPPIVVEVTPRPALRPPPPVPVPAPVVRPTAPERPEPLPPPVRTAATPPPASTLAEPMFVKLISEERDLVIYWLVEPADTKESANESPTVL